MYLFGCITSEAYYIVNIIMNSQMKMYIFQIAVKGTFFFFFVCEIWLMSY